jgi:hypothetical protein
MPSITDMAARYSGLVSYSDRTKGSFHCQYQGGNNWSIESTEGIVTQTNISHSGDPSPPNWSIQEALWDNLAFTDPTTTTMDTGAANSATKTVTGMVLRLDATFTLSDNTIYPVSASYDGIGGHYRLDTPDLISDASNVAAYFTILQDMLDLIMDVVVVG